MNCLGAWLRVNSPLGRMGAVSDALSSSMLVVVTRYSTTFIQSAPLWPLPQNLHFAGVACPGGW